MSTESKLFPFTRPTFARKRDWGKSKKKILQRKSGSRRKKKDCQAPGDFFGRGRSDWGAGKASKGSANRRNKRKIDLKRGGVITKIPED